MKSVINERHNIEYLTVYYECEDINYNSFYSNHKYLFNVDLEYLDDGIHPSKFK
jgi:hypothetical protein